MPTPLLVHAFHPASLAHYCSNYGVRLNLCTQSAHTTSNVFNANGGGFTLLAITDASHTNALMPSNIVLASVFA